MTKPHETKTFNSSDDENWAITTTVGSTVFSTSGRILFNAGNALFSQSINSNHFTSIFGSTLKSAAGSICLVSAALIFKYLNNDPTELDLRKQLLITLTAGAVASLPTEDISSLLTEAGCSLMGLATILVLCCSIEDDQEEENKIKPN